MRYFFRSTLPFILFCCIISTVSCTIQKHQRLSGLHIQWHGRAAKANLMENRSQPVLAKQKASTEPVELLNGIEHSRMENLAVAAKEPTPSSVENEFAFYSKVLTNVLVRPKNDTCDLIIMTNGEFLYVSAIQQDDKLIRFTACGASNKERKVIAKEQVFMIKYKDGSKLVFGRSNSNGFSKNVYDKPQKAQKNKGFRFIDEVSFVGFIFGAVSIPVWLFHWQIGFFISIFAILMGVVGIIRIAKSKGSKTGLGFAIASLLFGLVLLVTTLILHVAAFI